MNPWTPTFYWQAVNQELTSALTALQTEYQNVSIKLTNNEDSAARAAMHEAPPSPSPPGSAGASVRRGQRRSPVGRHLQGPRRGRQGGP